MSQRHLFNKYNVSDEILSKKIKDISIANGRALINHNRIDLVAKHIYIDSKVLNKNREFSKELYASHISAFTHGKFIEQGQEGKKEGVDSFFKVFDDLIEEIESNGFDASLSRVPVDKDFVIMDGAHRTAVCSYFNLPIEVSQFNTSTPAYNYAFFKERMLEPKYLDFIIHRYIQISNKNIYTLCLWPKAYKDKDRVRSILKDNVDIVYEKEVLLTPTGAHSFVTQIYHHHDWVGTPKNGFKGSVNKVDACFDGKNPLTVFVIETNSSLDEILVLKEQIRSLFNYGKHSVHITDNQEETEQISELLLNANSIYQMNNGNAFKYYKGINKLLDFKERLQKNNYDYKEIILDGSGPMEAFGLREASDLDFISDQNVPNWDDYAKRTKSELVKLYGDNVDHLQSPEAYFYFFGLRFLTLDKVLEGKRKRNEKKDNLDAEIIVKFLRSNSINRYEEAMFKLKKRRLHWKRNLKTIAGDLLRRLGLLDIIKSILKRLT